MKRQGKLDEQEGHCDKLAQRLSHAHTPFVTGSGGGTLFALPLSWVDQQHFRIFSAGADFDAVAKAGLLARTNALMNLPSTSGAIASTSMPWPVRKARASSIW